MEITNTAILMEIVNVLQPRNLVEVISACGHLVLYFLVISPSDARELVIVPVTTYKPFCAYRGLSSTLHC